jgi:MCP family monocarboxylic acid transporter-like MFS transporter 13
LAIQYFFVTEHESKQGQENLEVTSEGKTPRRAPGMFYGWFMAGLGALLMALCVVPFFGSLPVWNPVLRNTFGWTAGQMSLAYGMTQVQGGFLGPLVGLIIDKAGPRRAVFIGLMILGSGFVLFSQIQELWHLYAVFLIMSFGASMSGWLPMMTVVNHWFIRRRAMAMALAMEGFALGGVILPLVLAWAIGGADPAVSERYGWENCALFIGILMIAAAVPLSRLVRNRPEDLGLRPDGDPAITATESSIEAGVTPSDAEERGYIWQEAIRTKTFWLVSVSQALSAAVLITVVVHLGLLLDDRGFSLQTIGVVLAVFTAVSAIFMLVGGYLGDRLPMRLVAFGFSILPPIALVVLVLDHSKEGLFLFAVLLGVGFGGRTPLWTAIMGLYFGRRSFAAITGISLVPVGLVQFVAPVYAGVMRDATGTYDVAFLTIAAVSLIGGCLYLVLGEPPKWSARTQRSSRSAG